MRTSGFFPLLIACTLASGCSTISTTIDAINPFSSSSAKIPPLPTFTASVEVREQWSVSVGKSGDYVFVPAVVGGSVYAAGASGNVVKIEDGKVIWKIDAGQPLSAGVGANAKLVVVGTPKGEVLAFSADDGKPVWKSKVSSEVLVPPAVGDDGVAVKSGDNQVFLLDVLDGGRKWSYQRSTPPLAVRGSGSPVFADRFVFVGYPGGKLAALALQNGAPVWEGAVALPKGATELDRVADVVAPPTVDGRQVCAAAFQGRIACFDMGQGGALIWSRDTSSVNGVVMDGRYLFAADDKGVIHALDRSSGSTLWKQDRLKSRRLSAPVVRRGLVAVADGEGVIHFLSREDGSFAGRLKTDGTPVKAPLLVLGTGVVAQTSGGKVFAVEVR